MSENLKVITDSSEFTPSEILNNMSEGDSTFEIGGFVERLNNIRSFGKNNGKLFSCIINNGQNMTIQVVAWNEQAIRLSKIVNKPGLVVLMEKVLPKKPLNDNFIKKTTCSKELHLQKCTIVKILGIFQQPIIENKIKDIPIIDDFSTLKQFISSKIEVNGYIKTSFRTVNTSGRSFLVGSITDSYYKLPITVQLSNENVDFENIRGKHISAIGMLNEGKNSLVKLNVKSFKDIKMISSNELPFSEVMKGCHLIN